MESRPRFPVSEYWYLGSPDRAVDALFRRVCSLAWPWALFCATHYLHDIHAAYDLMDAAVSNTERYFDRFHGERTANQLFNRMVSVLKRLSKQRLQKNREIPSGSLSDLEIYSRELSARPDEEQAAYVGELFSQMTQRSQQITHWRLAGHSWRQIAEHLEVNHTTIRRAYHKELRRLMGPKSGNQSLSVSEDND